MGKGRGFVNACMHIKPASNCEESLKSVLSCKPVQRESEVGVSGSAVVFSAPFFLNWRYSHCSYASVTMKLSRQKLKDCAPESLIRTCHRSNEYHLNCFVYWWSLDVDLICACV